MVSKERINRPKLCFRVLRPRTISWKIIFHCPFIHLSFFSFFSFLLVPFFIIFVFLLLISIFQWGELNISWNSNFSNLPSSFRHLITYNPLENIFLPLPPSVGGDPWSGYWKKNYQARKGWLWIIFYKRRMMKDGHLSSRTWLPKLKSHSLQEKNDLCLCSFHHFLNIFFYFLILV